MKTIAMTLRNISPFIWIAAFLSSLFFINDWQLELFAAAVVLVFTWAVFMLAPKNSNALQIPQSWVLRLMAFFIFWVFLSVFRSEVLNVSLMAFCFVAVMPLTFLVFSIRGNEEQLKTIAKILAVIFAGLSIWALLQFFIFTDYFAGRAVHPLKNPNSLAALLMMGFFCSVGWMLGAKEKLHSNMALILAILIFGGMACTGSRGAFFAMIPALGLLLFIMRAQVKQHWRCLSILSVLCAVLFGLTAFGVATNDTLISRVADTVSLNLSDVTSNRTKLWLATMNMIKDYGLLGTGIGTYFLYFPEYRLTEDLWGTYYAHSDPLQYWVELGVLGPVLFYGFIIAVIIRTVQAFKKTNDVVQRLLIVTPFCALGAVILHTHVTFNLYNLSILLSVGFLLSVWFLTTQKILATSVKTIPFPASFSYASRLVVMALPFLFIGTLFMAYIAGEHYTNRARSHMIAGDLEDFAADVITAQKVSMQGNYRAPLLAVNVPLTLLEEASDELTLEQKKDVFEQGLLYLRHVRAINPRSSSALYYLGKIQQLAPAEFIPEDLKSPEEYYTEALSLDPLHLGSRMELSAIYANQGKAAESLKILEEGYGYKYSTAKALDYYGQLAKLYLSKGDTKKGQETLLKMARFQSRLEKSAARQRKSLSQNLWGE